MNFRKKRRGGPAALQMTALMDVVFLLLCFFVTSSVFSQWETEVSIALPTAKSATVPGRMPGEIIINLSQDGRLTINAQKLTHAQVTERLTRIAKLYPGQPVVIRAARATISSRSPAGSKAAKMRWMQVPQMALFPSEMSCSIRTPRNSSERTTGTAFW